MRLERTHSEGDVRFASYRRKYPPKAQTLRTTADLVRAGPVTAAFELGVFDAKIVQPQRLTLVSHVEKVGKIHFPSDFRVEIAKLLPD